MGGRGSSGELERLDRPVPDRPGGELVAGHRVDEVGAPLPEADVLDVGAGRARRGRDVRVDDRELPAVVLEEPELRLDLQLEAVRRRRCVPARLVAGGDALAEDEQPAALVRQLRPRMRRDRLPHGRGHGHHHSFASSTAPPSQKLAERYFQPPSARMQTTAPSSSSSARRRATWRTAPLETPAKTPSASSSARAPAAASAFETSSFRSSLATSRIGGT